MTETNKHRRNSLESRNLTLMPQNFNQDINSIHSILNFAVRYAIIAAVTLLTFRFLLTLLGINSHISIVHYTYLATDPLVQPFKRYFSGNSLTGTADFEIETLVAILTYLLMGVVILSSLNTLHKIIYVGRIYKD